MMNPITQRELITTQEAREILGLTGRSSLRRFIDADELAVAETGSNLSYLFDRRQVEALRDKRQRRRAGLSKR